MARLTFKSVLSVMKETNVPFVFVASGDGKFGFKIDQEGGQSFITKSVTSLPALMRKAVVESLPADHAACLALAGAEETVETETETAAAPGATSKNNGAEQQAA